MSSYTQAPSCILPCAQTTGKVVCSGKAKQVSERMMLGAAALSYKKRKEFRQVIVHGAVLDLCILEKFAKDCLAIADVTDRA